MGGEAIGMSIYDAGAGKGRLGSDARCMHIECACMWELTLSMRTHTHVPCSQFSQTALILASEKGHDAVVRALLAAGANTEAKDQVGGKGVGRQ